MKSKLIRYVFIILCAIMLLGAGWIWIALHWSYSEGERTGYVQKLSKKGWICKTWEGEIAMVNMPGATPEKFLFTVRDEEVAAQINDAAGQRVTLHYRQHKLIPSACFGETEYFIDGLRTLDMPPPVPASAPIPASAPAPVSAPATTTAAPASSPAPTSERPATAH